MYIAKLSDVFGGYNFWVVSETRDKARDLIYKEYRDHYKYLNGVYPGKKKAEEIRDEIYVQEIELNKVEMD